MTCGIGLALTAAAADRLRGHLIAEVQRDITALVVILQDVESFLVVDAFSDIIMPPRSGENAAPESCIPLCRVCLSRRNFMLVGRYSGIWSEWQRC